MGYLDSLRRYVGFALCSRRVILKTEQILIGMFMFMFVFVEQKAIVKEMPQDDDAVL